MDVYSSFDLEVYAVLICDMLAKSDRVYGLVGEEDHIEIPMSMVARILTDMTAMGIVCPRAATA